MDEKIISKNIENDEFNLNSDEDDYKNLINRLKQIRLNIELLEKLYLDKF
jgi:hypothetical protein